MSNFLLTGAAGFIGYHVAEHLLARGDRVVGIDNLNDYYDPTLKRARLARLQRHANFEFVLQDIKEAADTAALFARVRPDRVIHLAAQAGVRYSLTNPHAYADSNLVGFLNILEGCRHTRVQHLVFASSSSVYGANTSMPFSVHDNVDHPLSLYAATKKANELMAHSYSALYGLPVTGLRFFTVYGPWGRPDMALFLFTRAILAGEEIEVFNNGDMQRDFTYVDDIVDGVVRASDNVAAPNPAWSGSQPDPGTSFAPFRLYNIGGCAPVRLLDMIELLEQCLGQPARKKFLPMQPGDVPSTSADVSDLERDAGFAPRVTLQEGISRFVAWYREYYEPVEAMAK